MIESCTGCLYDLGGGRDNCRLNLSYECRDGGGFEAWDALDETQDANLLIDAMIKETQDAPAVDAEPVRHGEWSNRMKFGDVWLCSECGFGQLVSGSFMYKKGCIGGADNRTNFCPNCGAKMIQGGAE